MKYPLNVPTPRSFSYVKRNIPEVTVEQRERALKATHYNEFAFPAGMLTVDMLSDSGTTAMTDVQWSAMFLGDESYGRNKGYYVLLDTFRDIFERGGEKNWKRAIDLVRTNCQDIDKMMDELYLCEYEGGLFNGGAAQMERPNTFIIQQGRAAESVLMEELAEAGFDAAYVSLIDQAAGDGLSGSSPGHHIALRPFRADRRLPGAGLSDPRPRSADSLYPAELRWPYEALFPSGLPSQERLRWIVAVLGRKTICISCRGKPS